jgi:hypothetical protein
MKIYEVLFDLPWHKFNIATIEANNPEEAIQKVTNILTRSGKGKVRKGHVREKYLPNITH